MIEGDHRGGLHPGDGQGPHRPLRRSAGAAGAGRGLSTSPGALPADYVHHIDKHRFDVPFVCGATNLGRRCGACRGRGDDRSRARPAPATSPEATGTSTPSPPRSAPSRRAARTSCTSRRRILQAPYALVRQVAETGALPVALFTAGGVATPADAAMMMQLGADGVFVGSGIFKSPATAERAAAVVRGPPPRTRPGRDRRGLARSGRGDGGAERRRSSPGPAPAGRTRLVRAGR